MELCGIKFEEKEIDGKWCLQPLEKFDVAKFQELMKETKTRGGRYSRVNGFMFDEKPVFDEPTKPVEVSKPVEVPKPTEPQKAEVIPAKVVEEKKTEKELDKPTNKIKEEAVPSGDEFEVYPPLSIDECGEFIKKLIEKPEYQAPDHQTTLKLLLIKCKDDEVLRANISHKSYDKMLTNGARDWAVRNNMTGNIICTPQDIIDDVVAEYKKVVVKKKPTAPKKNKKK